MEAINEKDFFKKKRERFNLLITEEKDRPFLVKKIQERGEGEYLILDQEGKFSDLSNILDQASLFAPARVMIVHHCDNYTDEDFEKIFSYLDVVFYFFASSVKKAMTSRFKDRGAILFLTQEKPWERKNRFIADVIKSFHKRGVLISQGTAHRFVETVPQDLHSFHQEKEKLFVFANGKEKITDDHIDEIFSPQLEENGFKVSEEIVWQGKAGKNFCVQSIQSLLQIIGAFRFQAHLGLKLLANEPIKIPPWQEKKYRVKAKSLGEHFFMKMLASLLDAELLAKQSKITPSFLYSFIVLQVLSLFPSKPSRNMIAR